MARPPHRAVSVSKNIMNEVMCLAEEIGATIHYTDTDSMHIDHEYVEGGNDSILGKAFRERYGRNLIGKQLGQFHTDFDFSSSYSNVDGKLLPCKTKSKGNKRFKFSQLLMSSEPFAVGQGAEGPTGKKRMSKYQKAMERKRKKLEKMKMISEL